MGKYSQAQQPLALSTPLGPDTLLLEKLSGSEEISRLFHFELDALAEADARIAFDKIMGQKISVRLNQANGTPRYLAGIVSRFVQGNAVWSPAGEEFTRYRLVMVPQLWLLTRRVQSRIFQQLSVPDILKQVLQGLDVSYQIQGQFEPRDYVVQYRESDFAFASRLMEDEGIWYFFEHSENGHQLVLANAPSSHPDVPGSAHVVFDTTTGGTRPDDRVFSWEKSQEIRAGKVSLWDHHFELPGQNLEATQVVQEYAGVGSVQHSLQVASNDKLEIYDYPGSYAGRFDGVDPGGSAQAADLQKIFSDNLRTAGIRMQEETADAIVITGASTCRQFVSGHKFNLDRHPHGKGGYVLTRLEHTASLTGGYATAEVGSLKYDNTFQAIPLAVPFRPRRLTAKPVIAGPQTATVVGPQGEEIFCDKYGRIKVQFHWDRQGQLNAQSSCWVRVGQAWAGKLFGGIYIPRVGQEVVVAFEDGDPDQPLVTGSVYNSEQMPPLPLPDNRMHTGFRSRSVGQGKGVPDYSELRFDDTGGEEEVVLHAQHHMHQEAETSWTHYVGFGERNGSGSGSGASGNGSGSGAGGGFWTTALKGENWSGILGNAGSIVIGDNTEVVIGLNTEAVVGINAELVAGANIEGILGLNFEIVIGYNIELFFGPNIEWVLGNYYEYIWGVYLESIVGNYLQVVTNGDLLNVVNGWVVQYIKGKTNAGGMQPLGGQSLDDMNTSFANFPTMQDFTTAIASPAKAAAQLAATQIAAQNPIAQEQMFQKLEYYTVNDIDLLSKNGDIVIASTKAGGKITLLADQIEILGGAVNAYFDQGRNQNFGAVDSAGARTLFNTANAGIVALMEEIEVEFMLEMAKAQAEIAAGSLEFFKMSGPWLIFFILLVVGLVAEAAALAIIFTKMES